MIEQLAHVLYGAGSEAERKGCKGSSLDERRSLSSSYLLNSVATEWQWELEKLEYRISH